MTTNNQIQKGFGDLLIAASLGYEVAWPGVNFDPPTSGTWLQVRFLPNSGSQPGYGVSDSVYKQGIYQVTACARPGGGAIDLTDVAREIIDSFPRGTVISNNIRVTREPYDGSLISTEDKIMIPVTIEYAG